MRRPRPPRGRTRSPTRKLHRHGHISTRRLSQHAVPSPRREAAPERPPRRRSCARHMASRIHRQLRRRLAPRSGGSRQHLALEKLAPISMTGHHPSNCAPNGQATNRPKASAPAWRRHGFLGALICQRPARRIRLELRVPPCLTDRRRTLNHRALNHRALPRNPLGLEPWLLLGSRWRASDPHLL